MPGISTDVDFILAIFAKPNLLVLKQMLNEQENGKNI